MHMRRQPPLAIEELDQERKIIAVGRIDIGADQLALVALHQLAQRTAGQGTIHHFRLLLPVVRYLPRLGHIAAWRHIVLAQHFHKTPAAVGVELKVWLELKWVKHESLSKVISY